MTILVTDRKEAVQESKEIETVTMPKVQFERIASRLAELEYQNTQYTLTQNNIQNNLSVTNITYNITQAHEKQKSFLSRCCNAAGKCIIVYNNCINAIYLTGKILGALTLVGTGWAILHVLQKPRDP